MLNPRRPGKRVDAQALWDERAQEGCRERPVEKQHLASALVHDRLSWWPGTHGEVVEHGYSPGNAPGLP